MSPTIDDQLFDAARNGDVDALAALLDEYPDKLQCTGPRRMATWRLDTRQPRIRRENTSTTNAA